MHSLCISMPRTFLFSVVLWASLCVCYIAPVHALPLCIFERCCASASCPGWHLHDWAHWWSLGSVGNWTPSLGQSARCSVHLQAWASSGWTELLVLEKDKDIGKSETPSGLVLKWASGAIITTFCETCARLSEQSCSKIQSYMEWCIFGLIF